MSTACRVACALAALVVGGALGWEPPPPELDVSPAASTPAWQCFAAGAAVERHACLLGTLHADG